MPDIDKLMSEKETTKVAVVPAADKLLQFAT